ncbi:MAG TPA: phosphocholine cytidylyltransferase family protein [Vicinamibacterales bacterium]|nr:phosphocholine cytidylyltransferase family protein [Vicinamibacterales bacterium]
MRAVILAAGRGGRLQGVIGNRPKALARVGERTLLDRQIDALQAVGISRITVVGGYRFDLLARACPRTVDLLENDRFGSTNSLYSLWLARDLLLEGFVVLNCDVLFHPQMLDDLLTARCDDALLVASRRDGAPYGDEEMKVRIRRGLVTAIAKTLADEDSDAENVGIARFGAAGALALVEHMNRLVGDGRVRDWLPAAFAAFADARPLAAVDNRGLPWTEIDFPEDYWRACGEVLPAIEAAAYRPATAAVAGAGRTHRHV